MNVYNDDQWRDEKTALNQLNQESEPELKNKMEVFEAQYLKKTAMKEMIEEFVVENLEKTGRRMVLKDLKLMETR
jgi:hypothetical protein